MIISGHQVEIHQLGQLVGKLVPNRFPGALGWRFSAIRDLNCAVAHAELLECLLVAHDEISHPRKGFFRARSSRSRPPN